MIYQILRGASALICQLPPAVIEGLARALAWFGFDFLRLRRRLVLRNLSVAFPGKPSAELRSIARQSYYHFILTALEFFYSRRHDIASTVQFQGEEHLRQALTEGKGAYILCMHLGNWEAMGAAITRNIAPAHVLVKKVGSSQVDRFVSELRQHNGFLTVKRQKKGDGLKAIGEILRRGEIVGFVMDQARPGEPKLPFFGHPAKTNTSFAAISRRFSAPIVPSFVQRLRFNQHVEYFLPPLQLHYTDDGEADITRQSIAFNAVVEECIRRCPEQYFWLHNRWK